MQEKLSKVCTKCGILKTIDEFHVRKETRDKRRSECKECSCKKRREYHFKNHKQSLESSKRWKEDNLDKVKEYSREYYELNKERLLKNKRETRSDTLEQRRAYRLKHKDRYNMHKATRRFLEKASSVYNDELNLFIIEECYSLSRLRTELTGIKWHVDHIIPLNGKNVCGLHVGINLQVIPAIENLRKNNKYE